MEQMHKHKGLYTSTGAQRSHPISRVHKDKEALAGHNSVTLKKSFSGFKGIESRCVCPIDKDGFIFVDLTTSNRKGVRVKFERKTARTKRTVGLEIFKN